jgi:hypothetical protein
MRVPMMPGICAILVCGCASAPSAPKLAAADSQPNVIKSSPLTLEKDEGERRVVPEGRPEERRILSSSLNDRRFSPGRSDPCTSTPQRRRNPDSAKWSGSSEAGGVGQRPARWRDRVHPCRHLDLRYTTWKGYVAIFSAPGFEDFMRAASARKV